MNRFNIIKENKIKVLTMHTIVAIFFYMSNNDKKIDEKTTIDYCIEFLEILENPEAMEEVDLISQMISEILKVD